MNHFRIKYWPLTAVALLLTAGKNCEIRAQDLKSATGIPERAIEALYKGESDGTLMLDYTNNDYCDYCLLYENGESYVLKPGKTTVFISKAVTDSGSENESPSYIFKGMSAGDGYNDRIYALPVKNGDQTRWESDSTEMHATMRFSIEPGDTVYATRYGTACMTDDPSLLTVCHNDGTFAAYLSMSANFISPGETVFPGKPVGTSGGRGLSLSFFFLDERKLGNPSADTYPYTHFIPVFSTSEGDVCPEEYRNYVAVTDEALVTGEMSGKERKSYLKSGTSRQHTDAAEGNIRITWLGDPVPEKDKTRIFSLIEHETGYYTGLGLDGNLTLPIYTFHDKKDAEAFLEETTGRTYDLRHIGGLYLPTQQITVITGYDPKHSDENFRVICHEISHHFIRSISGPHIPTWLNEGLARYFESCSVDRKGNVRHSLSEAEKGRLKSAFMIGEIDIESFLDSDHSDFMQHQRTNDGISYTLAHAIAAILVEKDHDSIVGSLIHSSQGEKCSRLMENLYPGGIKGLETDLLELIGY